MLFLGITKKLSNRGRVSLPHILPFVKGFLQKSDTHKEYGKQSIIYA